MLCGTLLFGMVYLGLADYAPQMTGWSTPPGKFTLALNAAMLRAPFILSILFMSLGSVLLAVVLGITINNELMNRKSEN